MSLDGEIEAVRSEIRTDGYAMSIGEWVSMYSDGEIDIHPEFQRFFRWENIQKSKLVESILLGIPIPPIFVSQRSDGKWDVIDGLQRLSTIFEFAGILKDHNDEKLPPLVLERTQYLPSLEGKVWSDDESDSSFTQEQRLLVKRSKISVSIILRESDERAKFELFQRLNTGGSDLAPQEVRNCIMVMINASFHEWLRELSTYPNFQTCIALSEKNIIEQYHMELALRFMVFSRIDLENYDRSRDVGDYITELMIDLVESDSFDIEEAETRFKGTFDVLAEAKGESSFRRFDGERHKGGFLLSPFEVIAYGIGFNWPDVPNVDQISNNIERLYCVPEYQQSSGSGVRANLRLPKLIPLGREMFKIES